MQVQLHFGIVEYDLVAILDLLSLLSVLIPGHYFEVYPFRRPVDQFDLVACAFQVSGGFFDTDERGRVDVKELYLTAICDVLALPSLHELIVTVLFILHLFFESCQFLLIALDLLLLLLQPLLLVCLGISIIIRKV